MKFKITLLSICIAIAAIGFSQAKMSLNCKADILTIQKETRKGVSQEMIDKFAIHKIDGSHYVSLLFKVMPSFTSGSIQNLGAFIGGSAGGILSVKWPVEQIDLLWNVSNVEVIQLAHKVKPFLSKVRYDTRADSVHAGIGLTSPFTGKNVLIGITDWGFDYSSPMFYDTLLQNTRILSAWDQFKTSGPHPTGFGYGTEFNTQADMIAVGSDTSNIYSYGTHGTHVAGIAGGSGAGTVHRGIAFESQFLMATFLVDEGAVLDAWQWMYNKAQTEGKRLIINMSWGLYHTGALDGTSLLSQALDNFSDLGVLFVTSAGNNGDEDFHIKYDFNADTMKTRINFFSNNNPSLYGQSIHAWGEPNESFSTKIKVLGSGNVLLAESPWYSSTTTANYVDTFLVVGTDSVFYNLSADAAYPTNNRPQMRLRVARQSNLYRVVLESTSSAGTVHYWNVTELTTDVGNWGMPFTSLGADYTVGDAEYSIGAPACTQSAISVASHIAESIGFTGNIIGGQRSGFSSIGPLITGDIKPDISAPGQNVASSISSYTTSNISAFTSVDFNGRTYPFARFSGTSMSGPAVAGIAALMLEANPNLQPFQVKQIIMQTARLDDKTGNIGPFGDTQWGAGKVNAYRAVIEAINTVGNAEIAAPLSWQIFPNPASNLVYFTGIDNDVELIQIINLNGQIVSTHTSANVIDISDLPVGVYVVRLLFENAYEQQTLIKK